VVDRGSTGCGEWALRRVSSRFRGPLSGPVWSLTTTGDRLSLGGQDGAVRLWDGDQQLLQ
jgi:hypothetical protein